MLCFSLALGLRRRPHVSNAMRGVGVRCVVDNLDGDHLLDTGRRRAGHRSPCFGVRVATWGGQLAVTVTRHTSHVTPWVVLCHGENNMQIDGRLASRHSRHWLQGRVGSTTVIQPAKVTEYGILFLTFKINLEHPE